MKNDLKEIVVKEKDFVNEGENYCFSYVLEGEKLDNIFRGYGELEEVFWCLKHEDKNFYGGVNEEAINKYEEFFSRGKLVKAEFKCSGPDFIGTLTFIENDKLVTFSNYRNPKTKMMEIHSPFGEVYIKDELILNGINGLIDGLFYSLVNTFEEVKI